MYISNRIAVSYLKMLSLRRLLLFLWKRRGLTITGAAGKELSSTRRVYGTTTDSRPPAKAVLLDLKLGEVISPCPF